MLHSHGFGSRGKLVMCMMRPMMRPSYTATPSVPGSTPGRCVARRCWGRSLPCPRKIPDRKFGCPDFGERRRPPTNNRDRRRHPRVQLMSDHKRQGALGCRLLEETVPTPDRGDGARLARAGTIDPAQARQRIAITRQGKRRRASESWLKSRHLDAAGPCRRRRWRKPARRCALGPRARDVPPLPRDTRRSSCYGAGGSSFCPT